MTSTIGENIKRLRLAKSMTQEQLAQRLNLSPQAVSKWENGATAPDIQLLPELSVLLGVTIDELFSLTDEERMERIENMLENVRFLSREDFEQTERYLREQREAETARPRATLLLAALYNKRADEYRELAAPLAREALRLNPGSHGAHVAVFEAERGAFQDWNFTNHHALIAFYQEVVEAHPEDVRNYFWLLDLLIADGRTAEARKYAERMRGVEDSYHYEMYMGKICKAECDLPQALDWFRRMTEHSPEKWIVWAEYADEMAQLCRYDEAVEYYEKAMPMRPAPPFTDSEEAVAHICEIRGDYDGAIEMQRRILDMLRADWGIREGEGVDATEREIRRLEELRDAKKAVR